MRPAAYIRIVSRPGAQPPARQREAIIEVARERDWPEPVVYADDGRPTADGYGPALAMLSAAVGAGRHDVVIMPGPGVISRSPAHLMAFLFRCNHHGVAVEFVSPATAADSFLMRPPAAPERPPLLPGLPSSADSPPIRSWPPAAQLPPSQLPPLPQSPPPMPSPMQPPARQLPPAARGGVSAGRSTPPAGRPAGSRNPLSPPRCAAGTADVLTSAGVEALTRAFPDWRIWTDEHGWHGRRRSNVYVQAYQRGAPAFCVHGVSALDLAAQLRWQQAADVHSPSGCSRR